MFPCSLEMPQPLTSSFGASSSFCPDAFCGCITKLLPPELGATWMSCAFWSRRGENIEPQGNRPHPLFSYYSVRHASTLCTQHNLSIHSCISLPCLEHLPPCWRPHGPMGITHTPQHRATFLRQAPRAAQRTHAYLFRDARPIVWGDDDNVWEGEREKKFCF